MRLLVLTNPWPHQPAPRHPPWLDHPRLTPHALYQGPHNSTYEHHHHAQDRRTPLQDVVFVQLTVFHTSPPSR